MNHLREAIYSQALDLRNLGNFLNGESFRTIYDCGSHKDKIELEELIQECRSPNSQRRKKAYQLLRERINPIPTINQLRDQAAALGIKNYSRMTKEQLSTKLSQIF
jgi:hypothetical protein